MRAVALVADLMDRSRVEAAVPDARIVASAPALLAAAGDADVVLVDLDVPGAFDAAVELAQAGANVVAYAAHVESDLLERAAAAGCTALARSVFFRRLPALAAGEQGSSAPGEQPGEQGSPVP